MDEKKRDVIRAAAYEQVRNDLKGSQRSKTSKRVNCTPPNVKCGGRCIPPSWDCRLKGQGTNSELKVHAQDISAGIASVQRGTVDLVKGSTGLNPARFERGRRSVIRGAVKLAPGDNLEKKKALRRTLEKHTNGIAGAVAIGLAVGGGYMVGRTQMPSNWKQAVEGPARNAFNNVLDRAPLLATRRARIKEAGGMAASSVGGAIAREARLQQVKQSARGRTSAGMGPLAFRSRSMDKDGSHLDDALNRINKEAASRGFDDWRTKAGLALFEAKNARGHNVFSERAANEYLSSQFGLKTRDALRPGTGGQADVKAVGTQAGRTNKVKQALEDKLNQIGEDMKADMAVRGILDRDKYIKEIAMPRVEAKLRLIPSRDKRDALRTARTTIELAMDGKGKARAESLYDTTVKAYDQYFAGVAKDLERFAGKPINRESPVGDVDQALTRFVIGRTGSQPQILSKSHGNLLLRHHYHTKVLNLKSDFVVTPQAAQNVARTITRSTSLPTPERAYQILRTNGFPNAVSGITPPRATSSSTPRRGLRAQQSLAALARRIQQRQGNENMSQAAALRAAKAEIDRRGDAAPSTDPPTTSVVDVKVMQDPMPPRIAAYIQTREDLRGKPCGASHIPKAHKCSKNQKQTANPEPAKAGKGITGKQVATAVALAGAAAGVGALASNPKARQAARVNTQLIIRGSNKRVRGALMLGSRGVVQGLSSKQVKDGLAKMPEGMQEQARKLVGGAKKAAAGMALKAGGYKVQDIDVANNFSTWKDKRGTLISVGSYGDSLVTYASDPSHKWKKKQVYIVGFNVDRSYDAERSMPKAQSSAVIAGVRKMSENHLAKVGNGILATEPWDGDGADMAKKRRAVYKRAGYNNIVGEKSQWALVEKGRIKKMTDSEAFIYLAESGEADAPMYKPRKRRDGFMELKHGPR